MQCNIKSSSVFLSRYPNFMLLQKLLSVWGSYISSHANVGQTYRHFPELRLSYSHFWKFGRRTNFQQSPVPSLGCIFTTYFHTFYCLGSSEHAQVCWLCRGLISCMVISDYTFSGQGIIFSVVFCCRLAIKQSTLFFTQEGLLKRNQELV